jgi:hypothetical protein
VLHGIVKYGVIPSQMVRLIGVAVEEDEESWLSKTISDFDVVLDLEPEHAEMLWL